MITKQCIVCDTDVTRFPSGFRGDNVFCSIACRSIYNSGANNPAWIGGKITTDQGYIMVRIPDHPRARGNGYVLEHIVVMEEKIGRSLKKKELVHHINGIRSDNRPENLELLKSVKEHSSKHKREKALCKCGRPAKGHNLCFRHLSQLRRTGKTWDFENAYVKWHEYPTCSICGAEAHSKGLCNKHYRRDLNRRKKELGVKQLG